MIRTHLWKLLLILFVVLWSFFELYPPSGQDLLAHFTERAGGRDLVFSNIVAQAESMNKTNATRAYGNLKDAVGTNELARFFSSIDTKGEENPSAFILNTLQKECAGKIRLGLDLQGGTSFRVAMDTNKLSGADSLASGGTNEVSGTNASSRKLESSTALAHAVEVLRRRIDKFGVAEPLIQPEGANRIVIQLPGLSESERESVIRTIEKPAYLEFRMVHPDSAQRVASGIIEPGYELLTETKKMDDGTKKLTPYLVSRKPERGLTGKYVKGAYPSRDDLGKLQINFTLDSEGADLFDQITTEYSPKNDRKYQLAIVLDGKLQSAPEINGRIPGGQARITSPNGFREDEAFELANTLENPLQAPVKIIEERSVEPSLGADSIKSGIRASFIGVIAVAGFMAVYYFLAGVVANMALCLNIVILLGVMCSISTTLTVPGIAGIVLTIGMAVDANVLIFERIREELAAGKSMRGALSAGYGKAFSTIFDSNLTTLISSVILIFMGTGPVKGFGVTLTFGVLISMFTALFVTRLVFDWLLFKGLLKSMPMLHIIRGNKIDFMRWAKPAFAASWLLIIIGIGWGLKRGHDVMGVDFAGGDSLTLTYAQKVPVDEVRKFVTDLKVGDPLIQPQKDVLTGKESLRITVAYNQGSNVVAALKQKFSQAGFEKQAIDTVGAVVGKEIQRSAIVASLLAMFGILVYVAFRYEFSFAVGAVVAILHDVLMTLGWFFLSGRELSAPMVAAVLTIIGFSINDTIVIFDRIREDLKLGVRGSFKDLINQALNQTLSRTLITSGTVLLATLSLYIFG
ncbi:MAG TPA: protein translocase subunit SecD, partial [Verrucomicrobiae bacterium]